MTVVSVQGQAARRGLIPRLPPPDRLVADMQAWVEREYGPVIRSARVTSRGPCTELRLDLHPAAEAMTIDVDEAGSVTAVADTTNVGPGYHTFVCRILERLGHELEVTWTREPDPNGAPPAWVGSLQPLAERSTVERQHLLALRRTIERSGERRRGGAGDLQLGLKPSTRFDFDGAVATPLGPRDDDWLARAAADPATARDIVPWWYDVMDGRYLLARALVLMWTEIRWRPPVDDAERGVMDEVLGLLRRALPGNPTLAYPWREWVELITFRAWQDPMAVRVFREANAVDAAVPRIGYRRRPVTVVHEGWAMPVPGTFGEQRTEEEWRGGEGGRHVTLAATVTETPDGVPMSADRFLATVAGNLGDGVLTHEAGDVRGRARLTRDASSGVEVAVLEGFSATTGSGAAIRVAFDSSEDWRWAVDLWRSLRPA